MSVDGAVIKEKHKTISITSVHNHANQDIVTTALEPAGQHLRDRMKDVGEICNQHKTDHQTEFSDI